MTVSSVRIAVCEEPALLARLHQGCFDEGWSHAGVAALLGGPGTFALVAWAGSLPAAFSLLRIAFDEGEILGIGTLPPYRLRGLGRRLLAESCREAEGRGARRLYLEVAEGNRAARRLYEGFGFAAEGRRPRYYDRGHGSAEDALILALSLAGDRQRSPHDAPG